MLTLRPSHILEYLKCPKSYYLKYVIKAGPIKQPATLFFGTVLHKTVQAFLIEKITDKEIEDYFDSLWKEEQEEVEVEKPTGRWTLDDLFNVGVKLVSQFPKKWKETGLFPLIDPEGQFIIERTIKLQLNEDIIISGTPDIICMNEAGEIVILDFKTASSPAWGGFSVLSDQLKTYVLLFSNSIEAISMGITKVDKVGFMEFLKRKKTPKVLPPVTTDSSIDEEFIKKIKWVGQNILNENFFANPLMAWNSPCRMCEFQRYCTYGDREGLYFPNSFIEKN